MLRPAKPSGERVGRLAGVGAGDFFAAELPQAVDRHPPREGGARDESSERLTESDIPGRGAALRFTSRAICARRHGDTRAHLQAAWWDLLLDLLCRRPGDRHAISEMMHTCPPPVPLLSRWLRGVARVNGKYGHLLFEEEMTVDEAMLDELRPYFESAHRDARDVFHAAARIDLHPDAPAPSGQVQYPNCLPSKAKRGLFGEVMAGLLTEAYPLVGNHRWTIPIFLFRYHADVEAYIFELARNPARVREVAGRHGNDFIALGIDPSNREVVRFIAGEAKWRTQLTPSTMEHLMLGKWTGPEDARVRSNDGVWDELNTGLAAPQGLEQLSKLLREKAHEEYAEAIVSLDRALLLGAATLPRTDLVLVAGNRAPSRKPGTTYLPVDAPPPQYTAGRPLQVIELVLENGGDLIDRLYNSLWSVP